MLARETVIVANSVALRELAADGRRVVARYALRSGGVHLAAARLATALLVVAIAGCAPSHFADFRNSVRGHTASTRAATALQDRALLRRQPEPDCAFRETLSNPATPDEVRMKLDYEQQCYRQAEAITRARLEQLQHAVGKSRIGK